MTIQRGDDHQSNTFQDNNMVLFSAGSGDEDITIIRNTAYCFHLPVDELLKNSENTRLAERNRRKGTNKIPRRQNAWILYRRDKSASKEFQGLRLKSAQISKKISEMWNEERQEVKVLFDALSRVSEKIHREKYGDDYVYRPSPSKPKRRSKKAQKETKTKIKTYNSHVFSAFDQQEQPSQMTSPFEEPDMSPPPPLEESSALASVLPDAEFCSALSYFPMTPPELLTPELTPELLSISPGLTQPTTPETWLFSPGLTPPEFFPNIEMIAIAPAPLSLELEQNVLVDARDHFFSVPPDFSGHVCDLSQTNAMQHYIDWTLYNPREIEEHQFSDYTSH